MTGYGQDDLRKISEVNLINRTGPDAGGSGGMYQNNRRRQDKKESAAFHETDKSGMHERNDISIQNTGYGPNGNATTIMIRMKDYTYQN